MSHRDDLEILGMKVTSCKVELQAIQSMMSADKAMSKVKGKLMIDEKVCHTAVGEDYGAQIERLAKTWDNAYQSLLASEADLGDHKKSLVEKKAKCANTTKFHADKVKVCKGVALFMDKAKCAVADKLSKHCSGYRKCFEASKTSYLLLKMTVKQTVKTIEQQLNVLDKIKCYLDPKKTAKELEECKTKALTVGLIPVLSPIKYKKPGDAECAEEYSYPCNLQYVTAVYDGQAELCTPCVGIKGRVSP